MNFQQVPPAKHFTRSLERIFRGEKQTQDHGGDKANYCLRSVASSLDKLVRNEEGQDSLKRADGGPL